MGDTKGVQVMLIIGLIEWIAISTACYAGISFDPVKFLLWSEKRLS